MKIYSGIGSQKADPHICAMVSIFASQLESAGWFLRSGHADGCDISFEMGVLKQMEIHLPWAGYNNAHHGWPYIVPKPTHEVQMIARQWHPKWDELSGPVKLLMCRNVTIVLGANLDQHAEMVVCWTPKGALTGGTAHGMKVAYAYDIPVFNLALEEDKEKLLAFITQEATIR